MKHTGIDLHTNSFTVCYLEKDKPKKMETFCLGESSLQSFINTLEEDEIAVEATGNSYFFRDQVSAHVSRVVMIAPWQFEVIQRSANKTNKHDTQTIPFFLSKDMLPKARLRKTEHTQLTSLIQTWDQLVQLRVRLINKVHGLFNCHGIKFKKETLSSKKGVEASIKKHARDTLEKVEIEVITQQLETLKDSIQKLEKEYISFDQTPPGFKNLISIKGIRPLSTDILPSTIDDIDDFAKTGNLAAYLGIVPRDCQSDDQHLVGRITKKGSKIARKTLVQSTLIVKRYSPPYLDKFYHHIKEKGGSRNAIIATARQFLNTILYTLKNECFFKDYTQFKLFTRQSL